MLRDIEREINMAKDNKGAGNVLCALGLMAYTEFMGSLMETTKKLSSKETFNKFFKYIGQEYSDLLEKEKIYVIFRCGLAHEYFIKETCTIAMLNSTEGILEVKGQVKSSYIDKPVKCGIIKADNGSFLMVIEKYYLDFRIACERLLKDLQTKQDNWTPPKQYPYISDSG